MEKTLKDCEKIAENITPAQELFLTLLKRKKCIWCKTQFPDGIIRKTPKQDKGLNAYAWFTNEFLVHAQTTHGYSPDVVQYFLEETNKNEK